MHVFPGFDVGGVQLRITSIMNRFPDRYRHSIVATNGCFDCLPRINGDVEVATVPLAPAKGGIIARLRDMNRRIAAASPDLLVTYNWGAIEWALANRVFGRVPHLHMESGFGPDEAARQIRRRVLTRRFALMRTRNVIVPSLNLERIARDIWKLPADRVLYVPNGVDLARFSAPPDMSVLPDGWAKPGAVVVGTVAPMRPEKNLFRMLTAFARVAEACPARLLLVGDGPDRDALERLVRDLGIAGRVHFTGYLDRPETAFGLMDVYAMSSDTEQMPNALVQAMAAARPVVATAVGDIAHIVAEQNRPYIVPVGDEAAFAGTMERLCGDAAARAAVGSANLARVRQNFDQDKMFETYCRLFDGGKLP